MKHTWSLRRPLPLCRCEWERWEGRHFESSRRSLSAAWKTGSTWGEAGSSSGPLPFHRVDLTDHKKCLKVHSLLDSRENPMAPCLLSNCEVCGLPSAVVSLTKMTKLMEDLNFCCLFHFESLNNRRFGTYTETKKCWVFFFPEGIEVFSSFILFDWTFLSFFFFFLSLAIKGSSPDKMNQWYSALATFQACAQKI